MGREAVGPMCCVMLVKEPSALIKKGFGPVFLAMAAECAVEPCKPLYCVSKKNYTLLRWLPNKKYMVLGENVYMFG